MAVKRQVKKIILAIDDMSMNLRTMNIALEKFFDVRLAKSGGMALSVLRTTKIDLILLDIEMPGMSGFEFMDMIKEVPRVKDVPVIFVTSHAYPELVARATKVGAKDYVTKPFAPEVLVEKVFTALKIKDIIVDKNGECTIIPLEPGVTVGAGDK